jgi:hypothetical protein
VRYPTISLDSCKTLWEATLNGEAIDLSAVVRWPGSGEEIDLSELQALASGLPAELTAFRASKATNDKDALEGSIAGRLHHALRDVPIQVLDDPGFWRYLTLAHFTDITMWREESTFTKEWWDYRKYVDGRSRSEGVVPRMYIRGRLSLRGDDDYSLSTAVKQATDLWRSHIVRVRTSYSAALTQGLVQQVADRRMPTDDLRAHARRINRISSNVVLQTYDDDAITALLEELYEDRVEG